MYEQFKLHETMNLPVIKNECTNSQPIISIWSINKDIERIDVINAWTRIIDIIWIILPLFPSGWIFCYKIFQEAAKSLEFIVKSDKTARKSTEISLG